MLTGESMPIDKTVDNEVIGATLNKNGVITVQATKVGQDTALSNIIKVVEEAQSSKAPIQRLADIISGYFVPIVIGIAVLTFIIWIIFVHPGQFEDALVAMICISHCLSMRIRTCNANFYHGRYRCSRRRYLV